MVMYEGLEGAQSVPVGCKENVLRSLSLYKQQSYPGSGSELRLNNVVQTGSSSTVQSSSGKV